MSYQSVKKWRENNPEKVREYNKNYYPIYYQKNKEKILAGIQDWRDKNKEKCRMVRENYRKRDPERAREQSRRWDEKSRDHRKNYSLKRNYGITLLEYDRMYQIQSGRCPICEKHQTEIGTIFHVDHDHATGKVRGLLCVSCNMKLGSVENKKWLARALAYLDKAAK